MKIQVLCGMICSGKSSYCKNAALGGYLIANDDSIVNMLHADNYILYDRNLRILYKSIENQIVSLGLCLGKTIVIDRGVNVSKKGRKRFIGLAKSFEVPCEAIIFEKEAAELHARRRTQHDCRGHSYNYWLDVANHHSEIYSEPSLEEGFDKIHTISFEDIKQGRFIL